MAEIDGNEAEVYIFDFWGTLIYSLPFDPINKLHQMLVESDSLADSHFFDICLTTNPRRPGALLKRLAKTYPRAATAEMQQAFRELLAAERAGLKAFEDGLILLARLRQRGKRLGALSNLWLFPANRILVGLGLGAWFENIVLSYQVGLRKPDRRIFELAASQFGVRPDQCVMIGDSFGSDIQGAIDAGMRAVMIVRDGANPVVPAGAYVVRSLTEVL